MSAMAHPTQIKVLITLEPGVQPIQGETAVNGANQGSFHGWLELNDRIEQAVSSGPAARRHRS